MWCERLYSNAMWHIDWRVMKDPYMKNLNLMTYIDNNFRCVHVVLFQKATLDSAVTMLWQVICKLVILVIILFDSGSYFIGRRGCRKPTNNWTPILSENEPPNLCIELINAGFDCPQTNGKLERFHNNVWDGVWHYMDLDNYIEYCNTYRPYFSLDMNNYKTLLMSFFNKGQRRNQERCTKKDVDTND